MEHTELPWSFWSEGSDINPTVTVESKPACKFIFQTVGSNDKANAAFIVKAVNNHENLLNELDSFVRFIERQQKLGYLTHPEWVVRTRGAREVIKQAEAES